MNDTTDSTRKTDNLEESPRRRIRTRIRLPRPAPTESESEASVFDRSSTWFGSKGLADGHRGLGYGHRGLAYGHRGLADRGVIQTKPTVNEADDQHEQEAQQSLDQIMRMPLRMPAPPSNRVAPRLDNVFHISRSQKPFDRDETSGPPFMRPSLMQPPTYPENRITPISPVQALIIARVRAEREAAAQSSKDSFHRPLTLQLQHIARAHAEREAAEQHFEGSFHHTPPAQPQLIARADAARAEAVQEPPTVTPELENRIASMNGGGSPLPDTERNFFESRMGADLSSVRVHTDGNAVQTSRDINARAFTVGNNIAFNEGEYQPGTTAGKHLLAHELTHTIQQGGTRVQRQTEDDENRNSFPWVGQIHNAWSAALHPTPEKGKTKADLPRGTEVTVRGHKGGWLQVEVYLDGEELAGYVSHELVKYDWKLIELEEIIIYPPSCAGAGFDKLMESFESLEAAAIKDGYTSLDQRITIFRKIYYNGFKWNILIPEMFPEKTIRPSSWKKLAGHIKYLEDNQVVQIGDDQVDVGHLLTGADAANHALSNQGLTTFVGDLGSVVVEYVAANPEFYVKNDQKIIDGISDFFQKSPNNGLLTDADMAGNADSYALTFDQKKSLTQNLIDYYTAQSGGVNKRYTKFAESARLLSKDDKDGTVSDDTKDDLQGEVIIAANLYFASKLNEENKALLLIKYESLVEFIFSKCADYVVDIFCEKLEKKIKEEKSD